MLPGVFRRKRTIQRNTVIMRTFVKLRRDSRTKLQTQRLRLLVTCAKAPTVW